jgi:hypothetical protein
MFHLEDNPISDWNVTILKRNNLEQNCFNFRYEKWVLTGTVSPDIELYLWSAKLNRYFI